MMSETYRVVNNIDEIRFFWNYGLAPLKQNELYFISRSARSKKLTEAERVYYKTGRSEMFAKQQIHHDSFDDFVKHFYRFETVKEAYLTKSGMPFPEKCLVAYINICAINAYAAMKDQMSYLTDVLTSLADSSIRGSKNGVDDAFYKVRKSFDSCQSLFARNFGTKTWVDIDIDLDHFATQKDMDAVLDICYSTAIAALEKGDVMLIRTGSGGLHCMIRKSKLHFNPEWFCVQIYQKVVGTTERIVNKNQMIPCPGTFQYENAVEIVNKEDFENVPKFIHGED
jgi:hypothetical protein